MALLELTDIGKRFGGVAALSHVSLRLAEGEIVGVIGPNGAGKTTLVNVVTGIEKPTAGTVRFAGERIDGKRPDQIARRGIARTFQVVQPFPQMSVLENVAAAALFAGGAASPALARQSAAEHLEFCGLAREAEKPAAALTLAGRKRLELAKSLALRPKLLLLDEVNAGLNAAEIDAALALIRQIAARGITVLIIEHVIKVIAATTTRLLVLHHGQLIADGPTADVVRNPAVIEAYLGRRYAEHLRQGATA
jgi:branched-chain amino acid transport system ATP-binding protein